MTQLLLLNVVLVDEEKGVFIMSFMIAVIVAILLFVLFFKIFFKVIFKLFLYLIIAIPVYLYVVKPLWYKYSYLLQ